MKIFVSGGLGFIGSHTCVALLEAGYEVVVADTLYNAKIDVVKAIERITGEKITFYQSDCCDQEQVERIFKEHAFDAVIHFAGYKAVNESMKKPLMYYENNLLSSIVLCKVMQKYRVNALVFSSSATVYGDPHSVPILESHPLLEASNPYGAAKAMIERILNDVCRSDENFKVIHLRYFNPIGAHASGWIGEDPNDIPNNLMPYILKVASGEFPYLHVYGNDYDTPDGSGVRDYIHVEDLALGHVAALTKLHDQKGSDAFNLGSGKPYSVLEVIKRFESVNHIKVAYQIDPRREGDIATCYADVSKAFNELHWQAQKSLDDMCRDAWNFVLKNATK